MEEQVRSSSWEQFGELVMNRFGKDQHELLIPQLFHIHQTGAVQEYIDKYTSLVDQLLAYGRNTDPIYYAMRFVDGLRADIRSAVHMHRPTTLDTACVLALLQEELVDPATQLEVHRPAPFNFAKIPVHGPLPSNPPPHWAERGDRPVVPGADRRGRGVEEKLSTLRDYRRARGLCIRCGEKWSRDHKYPEAIQLHVLQELWEVYHAADCVDAESEPDEEQEPAQLCLAISMTASSGVPSINAIQFLGNVQRHTARILVDSGSSHTFVSQSLAAKLIGVTGFSPQLRQENGSNSQPTIEFHLARIKAARGQWKSISLSAYIIQIEH